MTGLHAVPLAAAHEVRVTAVGDQLVIVATKAVTTTDPYIPGHFPDQPLYPGVFIMETVRQAVAVGLGLPAAAVDIGHIGSVRFLAPVPAGSALRVELTARPAPGSGTVAVHVRCDRDDGVRVAKMTLELSYRGSEQ